MCVVSYTFLQSRLVKHSEGVLADAVGSDLKGKISLVLYVIAIGLAFVQQNISHLIYVLVAAIWFIPDRRIEKKVGQ